MKNLLLFLSIFLVSELYGQANCPIFPKSKKNNNRFWGNTYTSFGANIGLYKGEAAADGTTHYDGTAAHLGISQSIKKRFASHASLSFAHGTGIAIQDGNVLNLGISLGAAYFFQKSFSGFGISATLSNYGAATHNAIHLVYAKTNKKIYNCYEIGGGFAGKNYFVNIGVKIGILVYR